MRYCTAVLLLSVEVMYSGTVVLLFIFVLVGLRAVWYCFLVVSGKSSTVLAVLYCFLTWYTNLGTRKQKRNESFQSSSSFIARARARSKIARAIRCSAVDI